MSLRVLVAEPSDTMRKIIVKSLHSMGVSTTSEAGGGEELLELLSQQTYDLVLTEWNLPGKSGLELIEEIRGPGNDARVIMVTSEADKSQVLKAIEAGVADYLVKPFTADTFREKMHKHLN